MTAKEKATALHGQGYNCAQAVLMAMGGATGLDEKTAASIACGFGGGAGCRELCGALSGAVTAFREKFGAVRCADLKAAKIACDDVIAFAAEKAEELLK